MLELPRAKEKTPGKILIPDLDLIESSTYAAPGIAPEATEFYDITTLPGARKGSMPVYLSPEHPVEDQDPTATFDSDPRKTSSKRRPQSDTSYGPDIDFDFLENLENDLRTTGPDIESLLAAIALNDLRPQERKVAPTPEEVMQGVANDLIASVDASDPTALNLEQIKGLELRLRRILESLGAVEELEYLDASFGGTDWVMKAQTTVLGLLGGLPTNLAPDDEAFQKFPLFYSYSEQHISQNNLEAPWNPDGTMPSPAGNDRARQQTLAYADRSDYF